MAAALLYQRQCNGGEETIANGWRVGLFRCFENAQDQMAELRCDRMSRTGRP